MAVHGELRPDDNALPLLVASAALSKADSATTRPTGSVRIDNGDGTETWLGEAASETGGVVQWVNDTTPPARPIGVTATCQMGVVIASWTGELEEPIPADFSHVEVFAQKDGSSDVVDAGMLYGAGSVTLTGFAEGDLVDVWAVAYDDAHDESGVSKPNASGKSDIATVVVEPVVSQEQLAAKADEILNAGKAYSDQLNSQIQTDIATAKKSIDSNTNAVNAAQKAADAANTTLKTLPDQILSQSKEYTDTVNKQTSDDLAAAKKSIDANTDAVKAAQKTADDTKTSLEQTASKVESIDSSLASVKSTLDSTAATVTEQGSAIDQANQNIAVLQSRQTSVESVANGAKADAANAVKAAASATDTANTAAGVASAAARTAAEAKNGTVVKTVYEYAVSSSPTTQPGAYYTYPPEWKAGQYIWVRTRVTYGDGSESVTDPVVVTGNTGLPGPQGPQGVPGKDGADGRTTYFHVAYANSSDGTSGFDVNDPSGKLYIGTCVDYTQADPTDPSKYAWQLVKGSQGVKGDQGIPGRDGVDGKTSYLHIAYAMNATGTSGFSTDDSTGKTYIGQYTDFVQDDSADPSKYAWTLIQGPQGPQGLPGPQGPQGVQGVPGKDGADGRTTYFHVAYANSSDGSIGFDVNDPSGKLYIGTCVDYTQADPTDPSKYAWQLVKGSQGVKGDQGIPGRDGVDGKTSYLHIAYAMNATGTSGFSTDDSTGKTYIGQYTDFVQDDSADPSKYAWTLIQGPQGPQGLPGPQGPQGVQGVPGKDGADGKQGVAGVSVTGITPYWATGLTAPAQPTVKTPGSPWQATEPAYQYDAQTDLYKCSRVDFSDGSFQWTSVVTDSAYAAARDAEKAARDAKDTATASETLATTASSDASTAKQQAEKAVSTATDASTTAVNANTTATAARTAASSANMQAAQAVGIANGKGDVLIQDTTPAASMQKATTLWIDTTGGANTPKKWDGSTWAAVTDKTATDAASQAVNATNLANAAQATADSARVTAANAQAIGVKAQAAADGAQTTADSKNTVYTQQDEPSHAKLVPGDLWYQRNNYRTYWQGEPDNSVSVMEIPSSRINGVKIWDGSEFVDYVFVADKVIAENSVTTGLLAADAIYGKVLKGGEFLTSNGRLTINDAGLVARDQSGNATLTVDAGSGAVSMKGALTSGSTVTGATVNGGVVKAAQYELWNGSERVAAANSSGVYVGDSLSYAQSGGVWKLSLANTTLTAPAVSGGTVTGGTVQTSATANRGVKLTSGGLVAYDSAGNATMTVDAGTGAVSMKGALTSGSTVTGATVNGGVVKAAQYELWNGSERVAAANSSGVYFGGSLSYAQSGGVWKLSLKNALIQAPTINAGTLTGGTVQTTGDANKGVKLTSGGLVAYGSDGKPSFTLNASDGSLSLNGAVMTNSTVNAATVNGGVITGANLNGVTITGGTIQTVGTVNSGVKITSAGLKAWDGNGNQTLDLNGSTNTMTGTFRTATSGARIEISNTTGDGVAIGKLSGLDKYGNVNWLVQGDITGNGIYGNGENPPDPLDTSTLRLGISEQNPEINIIGWGNGYRQISMGADRVDFTSSSVSDRTRVPDAGIYINGLRIDPYYVADISEILTLENSDWSEYKGADGNDPRTRLLIAGNLRFLTVELENPNHNILKKWRAATLLDEHIPANGINVCAAMTNGQVGDAYIIGRNVDTGVILSNGQHPKAGDIIIDPQNENTANWFAATFIYQV